MAIILTVYFIINVILVIWAVPQIKEQLEEYGGIDQLFIKNISMLILFFGTAIVTYLILTGMLTIEKDDDKDDDKDNHDNYTPV